MQRRKTYGRLFVPTLTDHEGVRHIIPGRDKPPLCGALVQGIQAAPADHSAAQLCQRCVQKHLRALLDIKLGELGL